MEWENGNAKQPLFPEGWKTLSEVAKVSPVRKAWTWTFFNHYPILHYDKGNYNPAWSYFWEEIEPRLTSLTQLSPLDCPIYSSVPYLPGLEGKKGGFRSTSPALLGLNHKVRGWRCRPPIPRPEAGVPSSHFQQTPPQNLALPSAPRACRGTSPHGSPTTTNGVASFVRTASCFNSLSRGKGLEAVGVGQTLEAGLSQWKPSHWEAGWPTTEGCSTDSCLPGNALGHSGAGFSAIFGKDWWYAKGTSPPFF